MGLGSGSRKAERGLPLEHTEPPSGFTDLPLRAWQWPTEARGEARKKNLKVHGTPASTRQ